MAISELCGEVESFLFEVAQATAGTATVLSVEPGTPCTVVDAWNQNKLVTLVEMVEPVFCGAAIGTEVKANAHDFKACALPVAGESKCTAGAHQGPKVVCLKSPLENGTFLASATSPGQTKQVFSRPMLDETDLRYMPKGTPHYNRLLTIKMEPGVWKTVVEFIPRIAVFDTIRIFSFAAPPSSGQAAPGQV
jgi:hypothetical protein